MKQVRVHWIDRETGNCGSGEIVSLNEAEFVLGYANRQYPFIQHWIVEE
jgi:hypothetical protein